MNHAGLWDDILKLVDVPGAVVAGGCLRDHFLGLEPKDIDVFIPCTSLEHWLEVKCGLMDKFYNKEQPAGGPYLWDLQEGKEYDCTDFDRDKNPLYGVLAGELCGYEVNIIARTNHATPEELVSMFDFGILQSWYDGTKTHYTEAQMVDCLFRRATLMHDKHVQQSINRFLRFNTRNPGVLSLILLFETPYAIPE